ncbi:MAG: Uma2 family endonuclease [Synechococcales bacterium]|nr:Uma2 family endonuclease [Synechococcales bacterium]
MSQSASTDQVIWTVHDLELFPDNGTRYEILGGELFMSRAPHFRHQKAGDRICTALNRWSDATGLGEAATGIGIVFTDTDNVIADVVWGSRDRLAQIMDEAGHLTAAPELVVEVLSLSEPDQRWDKELKLKLYSIQGVREYWIVDRHKQEVQIYRREQAQLSLMQTLLVEDDLTSPLLPEFCYSVRSIFE